MTDPPSTTLSRRERQVMDALHRSGEATVSDLVDAVPEDVSYSAVRAALRTLRQKGRVQYREDGPRYVYSPAVSREQARSRALRHVIRTFFDGSPEAAAAALLRMGDFGIETETLERIRDRIERAREEGR